MTKLCVCVSSVQKELEHEQAAVAQLISVDPFLLQNCETVLYDMEPTAGRPNQMDFLDCLQTRLMWLFSQPKEIWRR